LLQGFYTHLTQIKVKRGGIGVRAAGQKWETRGQHAVGRQPKTVVAGFSCDTQATICCLHAHIPKAVQSAGGATSGHHMAEPAGKQVGLNFGSGRQAGRQAGMS
jgi:hypothetical protein